MEEGLERFQETNNFKVANNFKETIFSRHNQTRQLQERIHGDYGAYTRPAWASDKQNSQHEAGEVSRKYQPSWRAAGIW